MSGRIAGFLIVVALVSTVVSYLFYFNPESIEFIYGPGRSFKGPLALLLAVAFSFGALLVGSLAFVSSVGRSFRERRIEKSRQVLSGQWAELVDGREKMLGGDFKGAETTFQKMLTDNPENVVARVHLAEVFGRQGQKLKAMRVLEKERKNSQNLEVLFSLAEIADSLENYTAAYDNLVLLLKTYPKNEFLLKSLVKASAELGRFDEAIDYQTRLARLSSGEKYTEAQEELAALELRHLEKQMPKDQVAHKNALEGILKRHKNFGPALARIAEIECKEGKHEKASKLLSKAYRSKADVHYLRWLAQMWLTQGEPERALREIRSLVDDKSPFDARLFRVGLMFHLASRGLVDSLEEGHNQLTAIESSASESQKQDPGFVQLKSEGLRLQGRVEDAYKMLFHFGVERFTLANILFPVSVNGAAAPEVGTASAASAVS